MDSTSDAAHAGTDVEPRKKRWRRRRRKWQNRDGVDTNLEQNRNQINQDPECSADPNVCKTARGRTQDNIIGLDSAVRLNADCQSSVGVSTAHCPGTVESGNEISRGMVIKKADSISGSLGVSDGIRDDNSTRTMAIPQDYGFFVRKESSIYAPQHVTGVENPSEIMYSDVLNGSNLCFVPRHFVNGYPGVWPAPSPDPRGFYAPNFPLYRPRHFLNGYPAVWPGPSPDPRSYHAPGGTLYPAVWHGHSPDPRNFHAPGAPLYPAVWPGPSPCPRSFHAPGGPLYPAVCPGPSPDPRSFHAPGRPFYPPVHTRRKLLVLDINGLLADIVMPPPPDCKADTHISGRAIFKRPLYNDFLMFCCERFDVGIWSSRSKKIIDRVVDYLLGDLKDKLQFCWNMLHCTETKFKTLENKHKPLVFKELRKLWEKHDPDLPWENGDYNESNTVLVDDSPYKALLNPIHTAIFPYSYHYGDEKDNALGPGGDLRVYLEGLAAADNVQKYIEQHPYGQGAINESSSLWSFYSEVLSSCSV